MRIMLDTNVLISALLFPSQKFNSIMKYIFAEHELVLSSYVVEELKSVVRRKFPKREADIERLLFFMSFEYVYTPDEIDQELQQPYRPLDGGYADIWFCSGRHYPLQP